MSVNYSEYNNVHLPRADKLTCFVKGLYHAAQKTSDMEGVLHQLRCIGYSDEFITEMCQVAHDYKEYHKSRIRAEQTADLPQTLYPTIKPERLTQYVENRKLITAILEHERAEELKESLEDAVADAMEKINITLFLDAYMKQDVDAMVAAITGWDLEALFASACIIPDEKEYFHKKGDKDIDVAFPFWGKETISVEEFKQYLLIYCAIHEDTWKLIQSAIRFAQASDVSLDKRQDVLWALLKDSVGVPEDVVRMVEL